MTESNQALERIFAILEKVLPILPFAVSFLILYSLYPASFAATWKGRTFYLFFLWLIALETILNWEELTSEKWRLKSKKTVFRIIMFSFPVIYVVAANFFGLNAKIVDASTRIRVGSGDSYFINLMPLTMEYLVFTVFFALMLLVGYEMSYLKKYALSTIFLGLVGFIYMSDNLYPNGKWTPLQLPVFPTTNLAASVLNSMGYQTSITITEPNAIYGWMPLLSVADPRNPSTIPVAFRIGWPCAGVESLLIYTITILLFLSKSAIPLMHRIAYFTIGAVVTYFINILRIVTIFVIAINGGDYAAFHNYYGQLYSITWIIFYPLLILGINVLLMRIRERKTVMKPSPIVSVK